MLPHSGWIVWIGNVYKLCFHPWLHTTHLSPKSTEPYFETSQKSPHWHVQLVPCFKRHTRIIVPGFLYMLLHWVYRGLFTIRMTCNCTCIRCLLLHLLQYVVCRAILCNIYIYIQKYIYFNIYFKMSICAVRAVKNIKYTYLSDTKGVLWHKHDTKWRFFTGMIAGKNKERIKSKTYQKTQ